MTPKQPRGLVRVVVLLCLCNFSGEFIPDTCASESVDARAQDDFVTVSMLQTSVHTDSRSDKLSEDRDVYAYLEQLMREDHERYDGAPSTTTKENAAQLSGVTENTPGDISALAVALGTNTAALVASVLFLGCMRRRFPYVYEHRSAAAHVDRSEHVAVRPGVELVEPRCPVQPPPSFFGWMWASYTLRIDDITEVAGLDHGMSITYLNLSMQIILAIGLPALFILVPLHIFCGGNAAGKDVLSWQGIANVKEGSWIFWVHAVFVWYIVLTTEFLVFRAMRNFMPRRAQFLQQMPAPRSTTILIEDIPWENPTNAKLLAFFDQTVFEQVVVKEAFMVKDTSKLVALIAQADAIDLKLERAGFEEKAGVMFGASSAELVAQKRELTEKIEELKAEIEADESLNTTSAFVTFNEKRQATMALKMFSEDDEEEIVVRIPPHPDDIIWKDLIRDDNTEVLLTWVGRALVLGLFFIFLPIVLAISQFAQFENLAKVLPVLKDVAAKLHGLPQTWDGLAGPLVLSTLMSILPTILILIFGRCFINRSETAIQLRLQTVYFCFLVVFVLLVTALGTSLFGTIAQIAEAPVHFLLHIAEVMAVSSHFYLKFLPVQWMGHGLCLTRLVILIKFSFLSTVYGAQRAHDLSEPEDQDFQGMGARSARFTLTLAVVLVFCTVSPLINVFGFLTFAFCRLAYGYLFAYAETTKNGDLGGEFFVSQLWHTQYSLFIFVLLMSGVLFKRADGVGPGVVAFVNLGIIILALARFRNIFRWEFQEFKDVKTKQEDFDFDRFLPMRMTYKQPELPIPKSMQDEGIKETGRQASHDLGIQKALEDMSQRLGFTTFAPREAAGAEGATGAGDRSPLVAKEPFCTSSIDVQLLAGQSGLPSAPLQQDPMVTLPPSEDRWPRPKGKGASKGAQSPASRAPVMQRTACC